MVLLPESGCIDDDGEDAVKGPPRSKAFAGFAEWGAEPRPSRRPGRQPKRIPGLVVEFVGEVLVTGFAREGGEADDGLVGGGVDRGRRRGEVVRDDREHQRFAVR